MKDRFCHSYGWLPDVPDQRDFLYKLIKPVIKLKKDVDLSCSCSEVEDQGRLGSCTSQALAGNLEFLDKNIDGVYTDVSRLFIYYNERILIDSVDYDSGASLRDGIKTLKNDSACNEKLWPAIFGQSGSRHRSASMRSGYLIDKENHLEIISPKFKTTLKPKGAFHVGENNQLEYWLNEPKEWRQLYNLSDKIVFKGNWQLNSNHDLELVLNDSKDQRERSRLALKGKIISVDSNILTFEIVSSGVNRSKMSFNILKLSGTWNADSYNRITFQVDKKDNPDTLTFKGAWELNNNQQIEYTYEKSNLVTKTKTRQTLTFEGFWKINSNYRLIYILSRNLDSKFDFRAYIGSPNIYPQEKVIKYRIGIGVKRPRVKGYQVLAFYGTWKFNRDLALNFSMDYGYGVVREMEFGAEVGFGPSKLIFNLKDEKGEPLGISLTYSYKLLNTLHPEVFVRLKSYQKSQGIEVGLTIPF